MIFVGFCTLKLLIINVNVCDFFPCTICSVFSALKYPTWVEMGYFWDIFPP